MRIFFFILTFTLATKSWADNIAFFNPYISWAKKTENKIRKELNNISLTPTVFSRFIDFEESIKLLNPPLIFAPSSFSYKNSSHHLIARGISGDSSQYKLNLYCEKGHAPSRLEGLRVGIIQITPLELSQAHLQSILNFKIKSVRTVPKLEDIINLLAFEMVDLIALPAFAAEDIEKMFSFPLEKVSESKPIDLDGIYSKEQPSPAIYLKYQALENLDFKLLQEIHLTRIKWRKD